MEKVGGILGDYLGVKRRSTRSTEIKGESQEQRLRASLASS
jgi:hypothetical protein